MGLLDVAPNLMGLLDAPNLMGLPCIAGAVLEGPKTDCEQVPGLTRNPHA